jgi:hypothetical protein
MRLLSLALVSLLAFPALAQEFSSLEERMSAREFREAGLDKLSAEELAALNAWLQRELGGMAASTPAQPVDRTGFRDSTIGVEVVSRVVGEFNGWVKGTRFTLENGQVWEVVDPDRFTAKVPNATVRIRPGSFGSWFISVEGYNSQTRVKRIR